MKGVSQPQLAGKIIIKIGILEISFVILLWASMLVEAIVDGRQAYGIDINPCLAPCIESFVLLFFGDYLRLREATRELVKEDSFLHTDVLFGLYYTAKFTD
jgi:hypothetical protein